MDAEYTAAIRDAVDACLAESFSDQISVTAVRNEAEWALEDENDPAVEPFVMAVAGELLEAGLVYREYSDSRTFEQVERDQALARVTELLRSDDRWETFRGWFVRLEAES